MPNVGAATGSVERIPRGGTVGQLLGKASNADYDLGWVTPSAPHSSGMIVPVGSWLDNRLANSINRTNVASMAVNNTVYIPIWVFETMSVDALCAYTVGTGSTADSWFLSISAINATTGLPGVMLGSGTSSGTITNGANNTALSVSLTTPVTLQPGWSYVAFSHTSSLNMSGFNGGCQGAPYSQANTSGTTVPGMSALYGWQATGFGVTTSNPTVTAFTTLGLIVYMRRSA